MSEGPSTPFNGPNLANGTSPADQLRLEAARKRLKMERATSESESPLDAQIRRMTRELEELKKQRQVAELQEQILVEQQLLEASRHRYSVAAASASPKNSPAPPSSTSTLASPPIASLPLPPQPQPPQPLAKAPNQPNNAPAAASPAVSRPPVAPLPAAVQQPQTPRAPGQAPNGQPLNGQPLNGQPLNGQPLNGQAQNTPTPVKRELANTPTQVQSFAIPKISNGVVNSTSAQRPNAVTASSPEISKQQLQHQHQHQHQLQEQQQLRAQQLKEQQQREQQQKAQQQKVRPPPPPPQQQGQQQQQQQRPWFDRPRTPGAPADSTLEKVPPYQGRSRDEYTDFVSALETHFSKAPQYYSKDREYRQVKLGLQHLASTPREAWYALEDRTQTWQGFRTFLLKEVVKRSFEQPRPKATPQTPTLTTNAVTAQNPAAQQPPQSQSNTSMNQQSQPAWASPQARDNGSMLDGVPRDAADVISATVFERYKNSEQTLGETVQSFSKRLQGLALFLKAEVSLQDRMGFLKKGVVTSIRNRAHRPLSYFKTYDEYVVYLQDIEDTLPQRQAELKKEQPPRSQPTTTRGWIPVPRDASTGVQTSQRSPPPGPRGRSPARAGKAQGNNQQAPKSLNGSSVRSQASPGHLPARPGNGPTSPGARKLEARRMSSPAPPDPYLKVTDGRDWWSCRNFIGHMEVHFRKYPQYYTEDRKVAAGRRCIAPSLMGEFNAYASKRPQMTWFDVCVFVINQSAQSFTPTEATTRYLRTSQKEHQKIRDFALWLQQFAPHYRRPGWDELRHLYDRALPAIKRRARKDWKDFNSLASFVAYLEAVENNAPDLPRGKGSDNGPLPGSRKRSRED
ncbi:hypothetical protein PENSUB_3042 [Penicillium subrubescens]|uniref:Retrotransposon gag domain-containing protein n=1 Tax=Penicillium subrubescens TaxID=1316194 RepID=A0A1Q5URG6_9EURO|nr:hypothetical protein PENSUB_3042 [Penicillium subrubescens]